MCNFWDVPVRRSTSPIIIICCCHFAKRSRWRGRAVEYKAAWSDDLQDELRKFYEESQPTSRRTFRCCDCIRPMKRFKTYSMLIKMRTDSIVVAEYTTVHTRKRETSDGDSTLRLTNKEAQFKGNMHHFWNWGSKWSPYNPDTEFTFIFSFKSKIRKRQPL